MTCGRQPYLDAKLYFPCNADKGIKTPVLCKDIKLTFVLLRRRHELIVYENIRRPETQKRLFGNPVKINRGLLSQTDVTKSRSCVDRHNVATWSA